MDHLLTNFANWVIICLAGSESGADPLELEKMLGQKRYETAIEILEEAELLLYTNGRLFCKSRNFSHGSIRTTLSTFKHYTEAFDPRQLETFGHILGLVNEWNDDGLDYVKSVYKEADRRVFKASKLEKFRGKKVGFCGSICGVLGGLKG